MRLVVAHCEVVYTGRLTAVLPEAVRLLIFKSDGSVLVHDDSGGFKPLNWIWRKFRPELSLPQVLRLTVSLGRLLTTLFTWRSERPVRRRIPLVPRQEELASYVLRERLAVRLIRRRINPSPVAAV